MRALGLMVAAAMLAALPLEAQTRRTPPRTTRPSTARPAPAKPAVPITEPATVMCPSVLGDGVATMRSYCDVVVGRDPAAGVIVTIPPHKGTVLLAFDLHNRHTYSEDEVKAKRGFRRYTATIGVLAMDNTLLARAHVQNEFRTAADLVDRITGGVGPGGVKAVAPTGAESILIEVEEQADQVSILGEKLSVMRPDGVEDTFTATGRPIAIISNVTLTYTPAPPPPATTRKPTTRK